MSKIVCEFKLKDLYAIKHALEAGIISKTERISLINFVNGDNEMREELKERLAKVDVEQLIKDVTHEKKIVDYLVKEIEKITPTIEHYSQTET